MTAKKIRYAMVALGDIAQEAMLPGIAHTGNSEVTALVSSDLDKAREIAKIYGVTDCYTYEQFPEMLASGKVDAIYLSTPNWRHAEFAIPAMEAGVHVFVEKPLEISTAKCQEIIDAAKTSTAKLMVAYRLHFEPATLALIDCVRSGTLGDVHMFTSISSQRVDPKNHRATSGDEAGPVFDMAPYPVNAARYVFESEPTHVMSAVGTRHPESGVDFDDTVAVTLKFPGNRVAHFIVSYYGDTLYEFAAVGTKGSIVMDPGYAYGKSLKQIITIDGKESTKTFESVDQFGGEMQYFSDCIINDTDPEPDAEEGFADVRVLEGVIRAMKTGQTQELAPFTRSKRIDLARQLKKLPEVKPPKAVK